MTTFSKRIRKLREQRGFTQAQLGEAMGVSPQAVQYWERDNGNAPRGSRLQVLSEILGTSVEYLMTGKNEPPESTPRHLPLPARSSKQAPTISHTVPILDFATAAQRPRIWLSAESIGVVGTALNHSKQAFAVINPNSNMHNPEKDISFQRGDILIVEPQIKPIDSDFVFACTNEAEHIGIIAQIQINPASGEKMLYLIGDTTAAPNPFKMPDNAFICGTITERKTRIISEQSIYARLQGA